MLSYQESTAVSLICFKEIRLKYNRKPKIVSLDEYRHIP